LVRQKLVRDATNTNISCHRGTRATPVALYTKVDAQCDKLATVVGRTKLTTLATVDGP